MDVLTTNKKGLGNLPNPLLNNGLNRPCRSDQSLVVILEQKTGFEGSRTNSHKTKLAEIYHNYKRLCLSSVCRKPNKVQFNSAESNVDGNTLGTVLVKIGSPIQTKLGRAVVIITGLGLTRLDFLAGRNPG